ncbi:hypothetical protein QYF61_024825 [Mycteria americana]|uniref:Uncharacterized protein n=1 Tax=Mycteria americana TaxID=33587 RepID=A0AAN7SAC2_MYCAM|nr:hypothetical protein QYF61_024825 [Mycteria americana]
MGLSYRTALGQPWGKGDPFGNRECWLILIPSFPPPMPSPANTGLFVTGSKMDSEEIPSHETMIHYLLAQWKTAGNLLSGWARFMGKSTAPLFHNGQALHKCVFDVDVRGLNWKLLVRIRKVFLSPLVYAYPLISKRYQIDCTKARG